MKIVIKIQKKKVDLFLNLCIFLSDVSVMYYNLYTIEELYHSTGEYLDIDARYCLVNDSSGLSKIDNIVMEINNTILK